MRRLLVVLGPVVGLTLLFCVPAQAESHRATRLGSPATRFAPPVYTPEDLRSLFRDPKLQPDVASVLRQWGWPGSLDDLIAAAATTQITDIRIPVGATMPFMSSRRHGNPVCLRNVLWAGQEPAPAYAFSFSSRGRRYRCVTPKACGNFFLEDLGPDPVAVLAIDCAAPGQVLAGRPVEVCLTVRQTGNVSEAKTTVTLFLPAGVAVTRATEGGAAADGRVTWEIHNLAPRAARRVCAVLATGQPGLLTFTSRASGAMAEPVQTSCATKVVGVSAILLELVDLADPIEVGNEVTYEVRVTNQGSAPATNVRLVCALPASQAFVSGTGATAVRAQGGGAIMAPLAVLAPKATASWRVVVKATQTADARFKVDLTSDQFKEPIAEDESTHQY